MHCVLHYELRHQIQFKISLYHFSYKRQRCFFANNWQPVETVKYPHTETKGGKKLLLIQSENETQGFPISDWVYYEYPDDRLQGIMHAGPHEETVVYT